MSASDSLGGTALRQGLGFLLALGMILLSADATAQPPASPDHPNATSVDAPAPFDALRLLISNGRFKDAENASRAYLEQHPDSAQARYLLAYGLLRQGKAKDALQEYTRAASLRSPTAEDLKNVGQAYVLLDDYTDAAKWMERALQMNQRDPDIWYSMGRLRYSEQKYQDAAECFQQALVLSPRSVKAENNLGLALEGLNRSDEAISAYRQAISWQNAGPKPKISEQPLLNLAILLLHQGEKNEAESLLGQAAVIAPNDPRIQEQLGQLSMQQGNYAEARKHLEAAVRFDPDKSNLHFLLGQAYRHLGLPAQSKSEFEAAARLANPAAPTSPH